MKINDGKSPVFQGDIMIIPVKDVPPENAEELQPDEAGNLVVAHSETGHHHVVAARVARVYILTAMMAHMRVLAQSGAELQHLRPYDQHEPIMFPPGDYRIIRQREGAPEGWRRVAD